MAVRIAQSEPERAVLVAFVVLFCAAAVVVTTLGSLPAAVALAVVLVVPYALYVALARPLSFPFGLYVLLVPFDNLLGAGTFGTVTKFLGILAGALLLLWIVRRRNARPMTRSVAWLLFLVVWMLMSAFWALDQRTALTSMTTYAGLVLLYAVVTMVPITPAQLRTQLTLAVAGGLAAAAYGIHTFYRDPALAANGAAATRLVVQAGTTFIDPNHFANALLLPLAIITMCSLRTRSIAGKLAGIAGLMVFIIAILLSGSREALSGTLLIFVYYLFRSRHRLQLAIAGAVILVFTSSLQTSIWTRFSTLLETGGSGRISIWTVAVQAAKARPLHGYGLGNFQDAYNLFYIGAHQTYTNGWSSPAHNLVLHYVVELGLVGFLLIALFFWSAFRSLRHIDGRGELHDYRIMLEGVLIAIAFVSLTIDLFTYKYAWLVFFMIALVRNAAEVRHRNAEIRPATSAMTAALSARP